MTLAGEHRLGPRLRHIGDLLLRHRRLVYGLMLLVGAWYLILAIAGTDVPNELILSAALVIGGLLLFYLDPGSTRDDPVSDG